MVTIGDVASRAGVSRSTVSYVLSGKRSISAETRRRIEDAIRELGFTPNAGARALAQGRTFYTQNLGPPGLREAIAAYLTRLHG